MVADAMAGKEAANVTDSIKVMVVLEPILRRWSMIASSQQVRGSRNGLRQMERLSIDQNAWERFVCEAAISSQAVSEGGRKQTRLFQPTCLRKPERPPVSWKHPL
jgi:hypothetical protein